MPPSEHRRAYMREYLRLRRARERSGMEPRVGKGVVPALTGLGSIPRTPESEARRLRKKREPLERFLVGPEGQPLPDPRPRARKDLTDGPRTIRIRGRKLRNCRHDPRSRRVKGVLDGKYSTATRSTKLHLQALDYEHTGATLCGMVIDPSRLAKHGEDITCGSCVRIATSSRKKSRSDVEQQKLIEGMHVKIDEISFARCVLCDGPGAGTVLKIARGLEKSPPHHRYIGEDLGARPTPARVLFVADDGSRCWYWRRSTRDPRAPNELVGAVAYHLGSERSPPNRLAVVVSAEDEGQPK